MGMLTPSINQRKKALKNTGKKISSSCTEARKNSSLKGSRESSMKSGLSKVQSEKKKMMRSTAGNAGKKEKVFLKSFNHQEKKRMNHSRKEGKKGIKMPCHLGRMGKKKKPSFFYRKDVQSLGGKRNWKTRQVMEKKENQELYSAFWGFLVNPTLRGTEKSAPLFHTAERKEKVWDSKGKEE